MSPKEQFLKTPHAKAHFDLVQSEQFRQACNYAMLQMLEGAFTEDQMRGAKSFIQTLETIATPAPSPPPSLEPKLHHEAYDARRR